MLKLRSENLLTLAWLEETSESFALMGAVLSIVHPELYEIGWEVLKKVTNNLEMVKDGEDVLKVLWLWMTPFSGYGLISNCTTSLHRDNNSQGPWYDCLTTIREYEPGARLKLKNIGMELDYASGTMAFLLGFHQPHQCCAIFSITVSNQSKLVPTGYPHNSPSPHHSHIDYVMIVDAFL